MKILQRLIVFDLEIIGLSSPQTAGKRGRLKILQRYRKPKRQIAGWTPLGIIVIDSSSAPSYAYSACHRVSSSVSEAALPHQILFLSCPLMHSESGFVRMPLPLMPERWHLYTDHIQAIIQVSTEASLFRQMLQVDFACRHNSTINRYGTVAAQPDYATILQYT